jgi:hypothetical protein
MADALLDYAMKITLFVAPSLANAGYLHNALAIVQAKSGATTDVITFCQSAADIANLTDDTSVKRYLEAGGSGIYVLAVDELEDAESLVSEWADGYTVLIGDGFDEADILSFDFGEFKGVGAANFGTQANAKTFAAKERKCGYSGTIGNMFFAFGKILSAAKWSDHQYTSLPDTDNVDALAVAENKFNDRVSFGITSQQYGTRLALLAAGGQSILAPYILEEVQIMLQSEFMRYMAVNTPKYTITDAKLVEQDLQTRVLDRYIADGTISDGTITVTLAQDEFVGDGDIRVPRPRSWWRMNATIQAE